MMLPGEKVHHLRTARGWNYEQTAERVRAQGAKHVRYQHIQQLEYFPKRVPRYFVELAAAFGMTAEEFRAWTPEAGNTAGIVRESAPSYTPDLASEIRQISLALIVLGDWIHATRPAEAPLLERSLVAAAKRLGVDPDNSQIGLLIQAVSGQSPTIPSGHAKHRAGTQTGSM